MSMKSLTEVTSAISLPHYTFIYQMDVFASILYQNHRHCNAFFYNNLNYASADEL